MKPLLFRFRIAALSLLISGLLVVGFGIFFLVTIGRVGIARIDNEIRALGEGQMRTSRPAAHWADFGRSLHFIYGDQPTQRFAVRVLDTTGTELFASEQWPAELSAVATPDLQPPPHDPSRPRRVGVPPRIPQAPPGRGRTPGGLGIPSPTPHESRGPRQMREAPPQPRVPVFETHDTSTGAWRVGFIGNDSVTFVVAADLAVFHREAILFRNAFLVVTPIALLLLGLVGWVLASRAMQPVAIITRTAEAITARDLHRRVPGTNADIELQRLVDVINRMLERLECSFHQAARFSADAAHELQTPLTVLQGELDNAVQEAAAGSEEQQRYSGLLEEVSGLKAIIQKLLLLARADVGQLPLSRDDVDLSELVRSAIEDVETMAPQQTVEATVPSEVHIQADASLIGQVLRNMTSNAVKYGSEDGTIQFTLTQDDATTRFTLANTAAPIPEEDRDRIFDRFHRVDKARSREIGGTGLGLSLAREIARAHGGDLVLDPLSEGFVSFTLTLPHV
ncbi:MAG: HAMP domain-containing protein [Verrucomicrobia bacterium]|jgi:two-component system, OmpR family, heavy metal sensor histidine kinase CusS|nr:HAMP domain-containing protein [Verrucomicrobiota bacterium]MBT7702106.1 HAMP domain-containing protein [Verrucomicrobiota bacterium]